MKEFNDNKFRKIFTFLMTLALLLLFILSANVLLGIPISSKKLWASGLIPFLGINLMMDVNGFQRKLIVLGVITLVMGTFFHLVLRWPISPSLYAGAIMFILAILLYMSFVN